MVLRRARGYAPLPVRVPQTLPRVLAVGGHMKNTVAIGVGREVYLSQHVGDLDTLESRIAFENAIEDLCRLYRFEPDMIACDMHPDYASSRWAEASGKPLVAVQHHIAHAVACAAENEVCGPYLAVTWDGTGYGLDRTIWGGEFFYVDGTNIERICHLRSFLLPGGEAAVREGWRSAASVLFAMGEPVEHHVIHQMLERRINCPETTSIGRLFDAVASILGVAQESRFEGQAAMLLERTALRGSPEERYPMPPDGDWRPLIAAILVQKRRGTAVAEIARGFHRALADWIVAVADSVGLHQVVLTGGVFQNSLLTELGVAGLEDRGFRVYTHQRIPPNDGGIALGQAVFSGLQV
jgi:hydrogenase maturation protein HypF